MIKNKIHKCWRLGAGILLLNIAIFTVGCSSKSVDFKETTTNSETDCGTDYRSGNHNC